MRGFGKYLYARSKDLLNGGLEKMSGLVIFDQKGAFGPAMTLMYNSQYYSGKGVFELASLLKENFMKMAGIKPKGKKEFCAFVVEKNLSQSLITQKLSVRSFFKACKKQALLLLIMK